MLPNDPKARRLFVTTGGLKKVQEIEAEPGSTLMEHITIINACFPEEIVRYYSPGYPDSLLEAVEQYSPQVKKYDNLKIFSKLMVKAILSSNYTVYLAYLGFRSVLSLNRESVGL